MNTLKSGESTTMKTFALTLLSAALLATTANAATVSFEQVRSAIPQEAIDAGAPVGNINDLFVTTDADILSIGNVRLELNGDAFQVPPPFGSNDSAPDPAFIAFNQALRADSWITTPGDTSRLGPDFGGLDGGTTFGDLSNDGPQNMFQFARFGTPLGVVGTFSGRVTVAGSAGPESFDFSFVIPEPATMMLAGLGMIGLVAARRR